MHRFQLAYSFLGAGLFVVSSPPAWAQLTPDQTLGTEASLIVPNVEVRGGLAEGIEGGALRGSSLFHSFLDFNVDAGQRVYFANPEGVENIFNRVTGNDPSNIFGTLGVDGAASLFLLNPNGIVFGPEAQLDVEGSFFASTAERLEFEGGQRFSAVEPGVAPVLRVTVPLGLQMGPAGQLTESGVEQFAAAQAGFVRQGAEIASSGQLRVGGDLGLLAESLDLSGQVVAEGDLVLRGTEGVRIRDGVDEAFVAASRGAMLVQGDEVVDIFALSHPESGLVSGGDMVLRSTSPVGGDAHYISGGNFRILMPEGYLGNWTSPSDPTVFANGDIEFGGYTGASLHILAGGNIIIPGSIIITSGKDALSSIAQVVTLSDGKRISIDGTVLPTLDLRAGIDWAQASEISPRNIGIGIDIATEFFQPAATGSDILVGDIIFLKQIGNEFFRGSEGLVLLTNQYFPDPLLPEGDIVIAGFQGIAGIKGIDANSANGSGVSVVLDSKDEILILSDALIDASASGTGSSGNIHLIADDNILLNNGRVFSNVYGSGEGGNISVSASKLSIKNGGGIATFATNLGSGGNINIQALDSLEITGRDPRNSRLVSGILARTSGDGFAGDLSISTKNLELRDGALLSTSTLGSGQGGELSINADLVNLSGSTQDDRFIGSAIFSTARNNGSAGSLQIDTRKLIVQDGSQISVGSFSKGNGGDLIINASELVQLAGRSPLNSFSGIYASAESSGKGGNLRINTKKLKISDIARIETSNQGTGTGGDLLLNAGDIELSGTTEDNTFSSGIFAQVKVGAQSDGGALNINAAQVSLRDGAKISTEVRGDGLGGDINLFASDSIQIIGRATEGIRLTPSSIVSRTENQFRNAHAGNISLEASRLSIVDGGTVSTSTFSPSNAGSIDVKAKTVELASVSVNGSPGGIFANSSQPDSGEGGQITIEAAETSIKGGARVAAGTLGAGKAGNIYIKNDFVITVSGKSFLDEPSLITTQTDGDGSGGNIEIQSSSLNIIDGAEISTTSFGERGSGTGGNLSLRILDMVSVSDGAKISTGTLSQGDAGDLQIQTSKLNVEGENSFLSTLTDNSGKAGSLRITSDALSLTNGAAIFATTSDDGNGGKITLNNTGKITIDNGLVASGASIASTGNGGDIFINSGALTLDNQSEVRASSQGLGASGNIDIKSREIMFISGGSKINSQALISTGGEINLATYNLRLAEDSDITTITFLGTDSAGDINITANSVIAFDDSDILAFSVDGRGGNIRLDTSAFFGENFRPTPQVQGFEKLLALDGNSRVDVNASGRLSSGIITLPDVTFIQDSLADLPEAPLNPDSLIANSCVSRSATDPQGRFLITGTGGLAPRPGDPTPSTYPLSQVQPIPDTSPSPAPQPQIQEPQGLYRLQNGRLILSRECGPATK